MFEGTAINGSTPITGLFWAWFTPIIGTLSVSGIPLLWKLSGDIRDVKREISSNAKQGESNCHAIDLLEKHNSNTDSRVGKIEEAIHAIKESAQRKDEQFTAITLKLDQIPALATMLQVLTSSSQAIVPRTEVDSRMKAAEERLGMLERDVRERSRS